MNSVPPGPALAEAQRERDWDPARQIVAGFFSGYSPRMASVQA